MRDRHEALDDLQPRSREARDAVGGAVRPVADREVPLPGKAAADVTAADVAAADLAAVDPVQRWLDGEASEAEARRADESAVAFWTRVVVDAASMRRTSAPAHLTANVMMRLPVKEPSGHAAVLAY